MYDDERIDDLQYKNLKLIQKEKTFSFGVDAVLLANFTDVSKGDHVLDIGTGTGIIPILLAGKTEADKIVGLEIQLDMVEMAERSILLNNLSNRVKVIHGDVKKAEDYLDVAGFDVVVTNPPYVKKESGIKNANASLSLARHEITCTLEDVIKVSSRLLKMHGQFAMVHRPQRLVDIIYLLRYYCLEPKYIRFVHPAPYKKANLVLIKAIKGGRSQLNMMEPLYVYDEKGNYSDEINIIYQKSSNNLGS